MVDCLVVRAVLERACELRSSSESAISITASAEGFREPVELAVEAEDEDVPFCAEGATAGARALPLARFDGAGVDVLDLVEALAAESAAGGGGGGLAYRRVHSRAVLSCFVRLRRYSVAIEGTRGSFGFGSVRREESERITLNKDNAGDQLCLRMSIQIPPRSEMFIWYIRVLNVM